MGISSKKTKTTNEPWKPAQAAILQGINASAGVQQAQQPKLDQYSADQMATYGRVAPGAEAGIYGAQGLVNDTIGGKYLNANPYLDKMMATTNANIADTVNSQFTAGGRYGSGMHAGVIAKQVGEANNALQYQNYADERGRQQAAVGQASGLMGGAQSLLNNAADLPWIGVSALNGNVRQASQGYGTQTQTTSDPMGTMTGLLGAGLGTAGAAGGFGKLFSSDARVKNINGQVGETPDGLPLYDFTYKDDPTGTPQVGPVAQEVAQVRPDAVGPTAPDGTMSVDYGKLGLPSPTELAATATAQAPNANVRQPGLDGFIDRFANPDTSKPGGGLALLGQYLMASEGSPFEALGRGLIGARDDAFRKDEAAASLADRRGLIGAQTEYYKARASDTNAAPAHRIMQLRDGSIVSVDPATGQKTIISEPIAGMGGEPMVATTEGYVPRSQAGGMMPYSKPAAPVAAPAARMGVGGVPRMSSAAEAMKLPPGTRFVDPNGVVRIRP